MVRFGRRGAPYGRGRSSINSVELSLKPGGAGGAGVKDNKTRLKSQRALARLEHFRLEVARFALRGGEVVGGAGGISGHPGRVMRLDRLDGSVGGWGIG